MDSIIGSSPGCLEGGLLELDVDREAADLVAEDVERDRRAGLEDVLALDHRLVDLHASVDVVGLHGELLLEHARRAVGLERPDLHLAEALAAEASLASERLLRDQAVRAR